MQPLYVKVKNNVKRKVINGEYEIDEYIETENELEKIYGVSKVTIRKAISDLEAEGYLKKYPAKGTKVISKYPTSKLSKVSNFTHILRETGHEISKRNISYSKVEVVGNPFLKDFNCKQCICIYREYILDGEKYSNVTHYLNGNLSISTNLDNYVGSLYEHLFEHGVEIVKVQDRFSVEGDKLLRIRYSYDENDELIEISKSVYNTEIQEYITMHSSK